MKDVMNMTIKIDDAIELLNSLKNNGTEEIVVSVFDEKRNRSYTPQKKSVDYGIKVVKESTSPVEYVKNQIMDALYTRNGTKRKTLLFHI